MNSQNPYAAAASSIGYDYQIRLALLKAFQTNEEYEINIEALDDIELSKNKEDKALLSLKHKQEGEVLSNLSLDFWKSVNIWVDRIKTLNIKLTFFLCTTNKVSDTSFLKKLTFGSKEIITVSDLNNIIEKLNSSKDEKIKKIRDKFINLDDSKKIELLNRITIIENSIRINNIPQEIQDNYFRSINIKYRHLVYERLEGWWFNIIIEHMTGTVNSTIKVKDISLKLQEISEQYYEENLPINFDDLTSSQIDYSIYIDSNYNFVRKLELIKLKTSQIQRSIFDFYRAFNQRLYWLNNNLVSTEEINKYEIKLVDEWERFKDETYYEDDELTEEEVLKIGRAIFSWAQNCNLYIRPKVTEPFIMRGSFHILADEEKNKVFWHPKNLI